MGTRGLGRVYQRGRMWWVEYWARGRQFRESSGSEEREDAVNFGNYLQDMSGYSPNIPAIYRWLDLPAAYHGNAGGLSFADGHSEIHKWRDGRTSRPINDGGVIFNGLDPIASPNNIDVAWMQDHTTRPKPR